MNEYTANETELKQGGELAEKFCLRPKCYADKIVTLRLKINDKWSGWRIREDIISKLQLEIGGTIATRASLYFTNNLSEDVNKMDVFASEKGADWLIDNKVSEGDVIDCEVQFSYVSVPADPMNSKCISIPKVSLIFINGLAVVERGTDTIKDNLSEDVLSSVLKKLMPTEQISEK